MKLLLSIMSTLMPIVGCIGSGRNSDVIAVPPIGPDPTRASFPSMIGIDLHGRERTVPRDLPAQTRLVIAAYQREQQADVDTWIAELPTIRERIANVSFCELPVIAKGNPVFRAWVNNGMRSGIRDEQRRGEVITVYTEVRAFLDATDQRDTSEIGIFLLDANGAILARARGRFTVDKLQALIAGAPRGAQRST